MTKPLRLVLGTLSLALIASVSYTQSSASTDGTRASRASAPDVASGTQANVVAAAPAPGNAGAGKLVYAQRCGICHNAGGMGPSLNGEKNKKNQAATVAWIKNPQPPMPKLYPSPLSDTDVNDVAAYVETLAGTPQASAASVTGGAAGTKMKKGATVAVGTVAQGKALYGQQCASCHGASGTGGGAGPSLKGEKSRKNLAAAVAWIENPKPPMPKLYPSPLSEKDVRAVAAYVETL